MLFTKLTYIHIEDLAVSDISSEGFSLHVVLTCGSQFIDNPVNHLLLLSC
jgi:hypothetical protein